MEWIKVGKGYPKPKCSRKPDSFGVKVLVVAHSMDPGGPKREVFQAFYGRRVTNRPSFYLYGTMILPTHWMPMPEPPEEDGVK